jgi:hypothetical protein
MSQKKFEPFIGSTGISQIVTSSKIKHSKRVHAFTEQGVPMAGTKTKDRRKIAPFIGGLNKKNDSGLAIVLAIVSPCLTSPIATQV